MWSKSVRNLSKIGQTPAEVLIILRIFLHVISHRDLDLWPFDLELLQHFGCHAFKLCTKFEQNRIIHGWIILAVFAVQFYAPHCTFVSEFGYLAAFSNSGDSNLSDVENDAKSRTFWPPVKIRGGVGMISIPVVEASPTTKPPEYIWWPSWPLRECWTWCTDQKEKKVHG